MLLSHIGICERCTPWLNIVFNRSSTLTSLVNPKKIIEALGFYLSTKFSLNLVSNMYIPTMVGKNFKFLFFRNYTSLLSRDNLLISKNYYPSRCNKVASRLFATPVPAMTLTSSREVLFIKSIVKRDRLFKKLNLGNTVFK